MFVFKNAKRQFLQTLQSSLVALVLPALQFLKGKGILIYNNPGSGLSRLLGVQER